MRSKQCFDSDWFFHLGDISIPYAVKAGRTGGLSDCGKREEGEWLEIAYDDQDTPPVTAHENWHRVHLPHDWCVEGQYRNDPGLGSRPGSHGYLPVGVGIYRKRFEILAEDEGRRISIHFDGIMGKSTVWINGHLIGSHHSGYTSVHYDISDVLRYGNEGGNVILVKVDATEYEGWWYEGCGIYRHVWLQKTDAIHIAHWGTYVTTPVVSAESADVCICTKLDNESNREESVQLISTILSKSGAIVQRTASVSTLDWKSSRVIEHHVQVPHPYLWSPDTPVLYRLITEVIINGQVVDNDEISFGIRTIRFSADEGFFLNEKPLIIKGTCNHQDFAGVGVALPDSLIEYRLRLLKDMGSNAYRSAHHPPTPELLDICDRIGLLVIDENRKLDSSADGIRELKRMLYRDRNHPSVIIWSMENEESLEGTVMGARILQTLVDITRRIDPTRPTLAAMNHGWNDNGYSDIVDIVGYNYGQRRNMDIQDHAAYPKRLMIGSETASYTTTRGIYEDDALRGYCSSYGTNLPSWSCSPERTWTDLLAHRFLTGTFIWTGFDYRGEPTPYLWPCINSHFGVMDICGFPKDIYYYMKSAWTDDPMVHLFPHWNWKGREGELVPVVVYSNCDFVELIHNGHSLGEQRVNRGGHLEWSVPYASGELKAIGKNNGKPAAVHAVSTTGEAAAIQLESNRPTLFADQCDTAVVRVAITDAEGRVVPHADNEVIFMIEGEGTILGVGNGNPSSHEPDKASRRRAFNGWCLVLVQASSNEGHIRLKASSTGLCSDEIIINAFSRIDEAGEIPDILKPTGR